MPKPTGIMDNFEEYMRNQQGGEIESEANSWRKYHTVQRYKARMEGKETQYSDEVRETFEYARKLSESLSQVVELKPEKKNNCIDEVD